MKKKEMEMKEIRAHFRAVANIINEDDPELFTSARLRAAASQAYEVHRMLERLIGRIETEQALAAEKENPMTIGSVNDPMRYVKGA